MKTKPGRTEDAEVVESASTCAKKSDDGLFTTQFVGDEKEMPARLPITLGRNYAVRLYRPRTEILNGARKFS